MRRRIGLIHLAVIMGVISPQLSGETPLAPDSIKPPIVQSVLSMYVDEVQWKDVDIAHIATWLMSQGSIEVVIDWPRLNDAGLRREATIELSLKQVTVGEVLAEAFDNLSPEIRYSASGRMICIGTARTVRGPMLRRVYDVRDLVMHDIFAGRVKQNPRRDPIVKRVMELLISEIKGSVQPQSWDINGGNGSIQPRFDRQWLIITATEKVHKQIGLSIPYREEMFDSADEIPEDQWMRVPDRNADAYEVSRPRRRVISARKDNPAIEGRRLSGQIPGRVALNCTTTAPSHSGCLQGSIVGTASNGCPIIEYTPLDDNCNNRVAPSFRVAAQRTR